MTDLPLENPKMTKWSQKLGSSPMLGTKNGVHFYNLLHPRDLIYWEDLKAVYSSLSMMCKELNDVTVALK